MEKIILTDKLWQGFIGQAYSENLIKSSSESAEDIDTILRKHRSSRYKKEALTLFLLYDKTIIPDDHLEFYAPTLEDSNHISISTEPQIIQDIFESSNWTDNRDPAAFASALKVVIDNSEFIIPWAAAQKFELFEILAEDVNASKSEIISYFIDFAYQYFRLNSPPSNHAFIELVDQEVVDLFCLFFKEAHQDHDSFHGVDSVLLRLMVQAERFANAKSLSIEHMAPAAGRITTDGRYALNSRTDPSNPSTLLADFHTVRQVFQDANLSIPIPGSIKEAITMKSDVNFRPFQEQLIIFQRKFSTGQIKDCQEILKEIRKAQKYLRLSVQMTKGLRLVTYSSLPTAIVESLLFSGLPAISTTATILSTAGQAFTDLSERKNRWVLFGR